MCAMEPIPNQMLATQVVMDAYEKRFWKKLADKPLRNLQDAADRETILQKTKEVLGYREEWVPTIQEEILRETDCGEYRIQTLRYTSWPDFYGTANLYLPTGKGPHPAVVLCCGHGALCRLTPGYQALGRRLARQGAIVLINDNIGQGSRKALGHGACVAPFFCGMSVQGLIVMETIAWIRRLAAHPLVDAARIGACGNSGGGTLTLFLAPLCPELTALNSSGYPSTFWWLGAKEKKHCHCNLLPHVLGQLEMWELYALFAPRPLYLHQGSLDNLLPEDLFYKNARNVKAAYAAQGAGEAFQAEVLPGAHSWDVQRRHAISSFFNKTLGLSPAEDMEDDLLQALPESDAAFDMPSNAIDTDALAQRLSGVRRPPGTHLWDVYPPMYQSSPVREGSLVPSITRGETMQVLAQFEAFL